MKKTFAIFLLALFALPVWAQETLKIGVVDIQRVISESEAGKAAKEKFQSQVKKVEANLLKEKQEVEKLKGDLDRKSALLKEEDRRNLEKEIQRRERGYLLSARDSQEELRQREGEMTAEVFKDIVKIVGDVGKGEKFSLIVERSQIPYSDDAIDITKKVVDLYNSRTPAPGKVTKGK
ncbi:MAG: OmpH family outer membrane protein [Deltaproteobacteria bacterium]|nr:OmpH family outer membrane protein [Deltaproteobacteria bacterium]